MTTETMSTHHHTDEDKEGYSFMFGVLMVLIYVVFPLAFWGLILWLIL